MFAEYRAQPKPACMINTLSYCEYFQFIMRNELVSKSTIRDEDPRAALLKYAAKSDENPVYLGESINTIASSLLSCWRIHIYIFTCTSV